MEYYTNIKFQMHISRLMRDKKMQKAIDAITRAIKASENKDNEEDICYLYSMLAGTYFVDDKVENALASLEECEEKFPNSVLAKFMSLENIFWHTKDYKKVIKKADAIIAMDNESFDYFHKTIYLKGLAYFEIGQYQEAANILKQTKYYDLSLVEKLIVHRIGLNECLDFLLRALNRLESNKPRAGNVDSSIDKIMTLISQIKANPPVSELHN